MDRRQFVLGLAGAAVPLLAGRAFGQSAAPASSASLQALLDRYVTSSKLAGAVIGLGTGGGAPTYIRAGRVALNTDAPFDEHSVCRIYSMTKPVTGVAALQLLEDGKLRLDQPVADVVPELRSLQVAVDPARGLEARPATRTMTMRHLLTHTSGFACWTPGAAVTDALSKAYRERGVTPGNYGERLRRPGYGPQAVGLEDMVKRLAELPLAAEPGAAYRYAIGLDVMGLVIERVSGLPLEAFFRRRIFEPLKMGSTGLQVPAAAASRLTTNYDVTPGGLVPGDARETSVWLKPSTLPAGGAGLVSTAHDFARFSAMLNAEGELDGVRVMRAETARLACSNLLPAGVAYAEGGFGAGMRVRLDGDRAGEIGWQGAAATFWRANPRRRSTLILMTQHMPPTSYPIWEEVEQAARR